jgi:hypothetical protein
MTVSELWERGQKGWPRRFPVVQAPNPPLILACAGWGLASLADGKAHDAGHAVLIIGLVVWALEEAVAGDNWFRRLVGAGALVWLGLRLTRAL